jgi:hypothetical protein
VSLGPGKCGNRKSSHFPGNPSIAVVTPPRNLPLNRESSGKLHRTCTITSSKIQLLCKHGDWSGVDLSKP